MQKNRDHLQNVVSSHKRTQMAMSVIGRLQSFVSLEIEPVE
jgi:hypothetical protein